jgi:chromosome segregation protein
MVEPVRERRALLKLKKVELVGFKSFSDKTAVTFSGTGITCIVGPNGCGKSNIVDAISWVLGEQSHKSLRAERMADCIFNGTQKRPPMGLAEVTITLEDPELAEAARFVTGENEQEHVITADRSADSDGVHRTPEFGESAEITEEDSSPLDSEKRPRRRTKHRPGDHARPGEVVVARRLYRSGQSEYIINGRVVRLRDVQELFMGTGLGPESYAIIEQGRIGQVLSSKPMDRRAIIEEAAGVSKYKTKRRLAEAKLESSKLNLARVNDILVEIEKQLASLKRQAARARRYAELREQMRGIIRQVLGSKAIELDAEAERLANLLRLANETEHRESEALHTLDAEQEQLSALNYALESDIRAAQNELNNCALELDRAENRVGFNRERLRELETRAGQLNEHLAHARQQAAELEARVRQHQETVAAQGEENARLQAEFQDWLARAATMTQELAQNEQRAEELRREAARLVEEMTELDRAQAQAEAALSVHAEARARVEQAEEKFRAELDERTKSAAAAETAWREAEAQARALEHSVKNWQARIFGLKHEQQSTAQRYDQVRADLAQHRARKNTLEQILTEHTYTADTVQKLFAANGEGESRGFRAVGVLADYAEVDEQYVGAVEQFLKEELEYVVVETFDHARAGITMLREEVGGRATFFVDSLRKLNLSVGEAPMPFRADQGVVSRLDRVVRFRDPLGPAAVQFLPRLQSAFLVDSATAAEQLARAHPQYQFVTVDGTCYQGRTVTGGRPAEAGPLQMKRELRSLDAQVSHLSEVAAECQALIQRVEEELRQCEQGLADAMSRHVEAQRNIVSAAHTRDQARAELARLERQLTECGSEMVRLRNEYEAARQRADAARAQREQAVVARTAAEAGQREAGGRVTALRQAIEQHQEEVAGRRADLAAVAERLASAETIAQRLLEEWREATSRCASLAEQKSAVEQERVELESSTEQLAQQLERLRAEKQRLDARRAQLEQEWEAARVRAVEVEDALRLARQRLGDLREERGKHEVEQARNESDRQHLRETCVAELNLQPEDLIAEITASGAAPLAGEELTAAEANYRELKTKLENLGAVNMMALEEYNECEQRFQFLTRERDDLVQSIADTQQTIKELDEVSRQKFEEAFTVINQNFAECFKTLFGGGTGLMRLTEIEGDADPGIEIVAQPPGKRLQNVQLLSGGEKALTAFALLIGIFRYQPSPFCILDEVDAPLDESNVGRFTRLIAELSAQTQFLIVTHNKRTMEAAPVLYGVTMQEPGVSKLVSVRWEGDQPQSTAAA